ncbi:uncharacterized protein LOC117341915 isoform X2 [Pecten maximus]|uniref:uncharacterized protein LOC117341915 isoform X2 n=1 Tax=Pecten maximus TaxID=6579 RepID=UPI001458A1BB|nr:uncharacterized protein LOC117341915 isoform X2 [Pecten maximus]
MNLLLVVACLVSVNAVPLKRCDYDCVMSLVEHAYHSPTHLDPISGYPNTFGKRDISALLQSLQSSIANVGTALQQTFGAVPQHGSEALSSIIQTGLHPIAGLLNGVLDGFQKVDMVEPQKRGVKDFFSNLGHQLSSTFTDIGHAFQDTFTGLAQTAAQQGTDLLSQALQGGAMVVANGANTLATNLAHTDAQKRNAHDFFANLGHQLSETFTTLGQAFQGTFQGLAHAATQQGTDLLSQTLQGGAVDTLQPAQKRSLGDVLGELQHQIQHLGELFNPLLHPDQVVPVQARNAADFLNNLQHQVEQLSNLLQSHLQH